MYVNNCILSVKLTEKLYQVRISTRHIIDSENAINFNLSRHRHH